MKNILLILFCFVAVKAEFELQYIGDSFNDNEAREREFCTTKLCIEDSQILFYAASQNVSVDPCLDFKEFSMGTFIKYRALHERYFAVGLQYDVKKAHNERQRKTLTAKIQESDSRIFKIMKNFFEKCVSSSELVSQGHAIIH